MGDMGRRLPTKPEYDGSSALADPKQELFCEIYTTNTLPAFWGNGSQSYRFAYGYTERIDELHRQINGTKKDRKGLSKVAVQREIERIENVCRASAPRLLLHVAVKKRCNYLLDQTAGNLIVDRELLYVIQQRSDLEVKVRAIAHHDRREQRIREKVDIKHEFEAIHGFDYVRPAAKAAK